MTYNLRCTICDMAFEMGMSEEQFYDRFSFHERNQLVATYRSRLNRGTAMALAPVKAPQ